MIIKIKEKDNDFIVYKYDNSTQKIIKSQMNRIDTINALNNDPDNVQMLKYECMNFKKTLKEKYDAKCMTTLLLIGLLLSIIVGYNINLFIGYIIIALSAFPIKMIINNYVNKKSNIYNKKMIYEENKNVCNEIQKKKLHKAGYNGTLLDIYFCEEYQITKEIKEYNKLNEEKHHFENYELNLNNNNLNCKKLMHRLKRHI